MSSKIRWITRTALLLAVLILAQYIGSIMGGQLMGQLITGSIVNMTLIIAGVFVGYSSGLAIAIISPIIANFIGIGPKIVELVPVIIIGNIVIVVVVTFFFRLANKNKGIVSAGISLGGIIIGAVAKFIVLYSSAAKILPALGVNVMPPVIKMMSWPQIITATAGGILAFIILPTLRIAIKNKG
ncbi:MAG: ECF transporter S component [Clostridiales bacterium]|nr:ECF transporter S component [Clostridiales bacterium]